MVQSKVDPESKINSEITDSRNYSNRLSELLRKFLFNLDDLEAIKQAVSQHAKGEITSKALKQLLLNSRMAILEELKQFFPFYATYTKSNGTSPNSNSELKKANQTITDLTQQLEERDGLLREIIPRIKHLENHLDIHTIQPKPIESSKFSDSLEIQKPINLREEFQRVIEQIELNEWLKAFRRDKNDNIKRNDSQFFQNAFTALRNYYKKHFSIPEKTELNNPEILNALEVPPEIKDGLYHSLMVRTNLSHYFYEETDEDVELVYTSFFQVIFYLIKEQLNETIKTNFKNQIISYFTELISNEIRNQDFILRIAIKALNQIFK